MNLIEHYINNVLSVRDITEEYTIRMKRFNKDFFIGEPIYEVEMDINCYGVKEVVIEVWTKSEYEAHVQRGYYMA